MDKLLFVGIGGFLGANARYIVSTWIAGWLGTQFPFWTLMVNVTGSFLLGAFAAIVAQRSDIPGSVQLLIGTGFFGAYTTFSTYAVEGVMLARNGHWGMMLGNVIGTNILCLLGAVAGILLVSRLA